MYRCIYIYIYIHRICGSKYAYEIMYFSPDFPIYFKPVAEDTTYFRHRTWRK